METFSEVRNHILDLYELRIDEPFIISFEFSIEGGDRRQSIRAIPQRHPQLRPWNLIPVCWAAHPLDRTTTCRATTA